MKNKRTLVPWLVSGRDFSRYLYRALRECRRGRVIFFTYRFKEEKHLRIFKIIRCPVREIEDRNACASYAAGRVKRVRLEALPRFDEIRRYRSQRVSPP